MDDQSWDKKYVIAFFKSILLFVFIFIFLQFSYILYSVLFNQSFLFFNFFSLSENFFYYLISFYLLILFYFLYKAKTDFI